MKSRWIIFLIFFLPLINATIILGKNPLQLTKHEYAKNEPLQGWINISLKDEPSNSIIEGFYNRTNLLEFLQNNGAQFECYPPDCETRYISRGEGSESKEFSLRLLESKLLGIKISGNITDVDFLRFNITSDVGKTCLVPLAIDVLNDGILEWIATDTTEELCSVDEEELFGCFKESEYQGQQAVIGNEPLCEKIRLVPRGRYKIGAIVEGNEPAMLEMILNTDEGREVCNVRINRSGEVSCNVNLTAPVIDKENVYVCIRAIEGSENKYKINYEETDPCGYVESSSKNIQHDFQIFAIPLKYAALGTKVFDSRTTGNEKNLIDAIKSYLDIKYQSRCNPSCIIPIRILAGPEQKITISGVDFSYKREGLTTSEKKLYSIEEKPALINADFQRLDLEKADIRVPQMFGAYPLILRIGDRTLTSNITVLKMPEILLAYPRRVSAVVENEFRVVIKNASESYSYQWDFGDGSSYSTTEPKIIHSYSNVGSYTLTVNVSGREGTSSKSFSIEVVPPYEEINYTLHKYEKYLSTTMNKLQSLPQKIREYIEKRKNIEDIDSSVRRIKERYKTTLKSENDVLIKIMQDLLRLKVPKDVIISKELKDSRFIQNLDAIDPNTILRIQEGEDLENSSENILSAEEYAQKIEGWMEDNIDLNISLKEYSLVYENEKETVVTELEFKLVSKEAVDNFYIFIEGDPSKIEVIGDVDFKEMDNDNGVYLKFEGLEAGQEISFKVLHPEELNIERLPIYYAPYVPDIFTELEIAPCNYNNICEKEKGENPSNCRSDCYPWKKTILWLIILFVFAFMVYVGLQEWYKRYYESYLFKDKTQLFNLINFMSSAEKQGLNKKEIFKKLQEFKWSGEQMEYAWRKLHGMRTGMWEIPLFKWLEKRQVKRELEKRKTQRGSLQDGDKVN